MFPIRLGSRIISATMDTIDRAAEWRRLKETYREMADEELTVIANEAYQLTDLAKEALQAEITTRRLDLKSQLEPPEIDEPVGPEPDKTESDSWFDNDDEDDEEAPREFDPESLGLVVIRRVWDVNEARTTMSILKNAGIPSYMGDENIEDIEKYTGSFDGGIDVKVSSVDQGWASNALAYNWPEDTAAEESPLEDEAEYAICCPKCRSTEVVFEGRDGELTGNAAFQAKFQWHCDSCGHTWEDDGVERPV